MAVFLGAVVAVAVAQADPFTVNSTTDAVDATPGDGVCATAAAECTLRAAVQEANAHTGPDLIAVPAGAYELSLVGPLEDDAATGDLDVTDALQVNGAGAETTIIDGLNSDRLFDVLSATFAIRDVTIRDGRPPDVVNSPENEARVMGGGIRVFSCGSGCTVERVTFEDNASMTRGGGLGVYTRSDVTIDGATFRSNEALGGDGGGLYVVAGDADTGSVSLTNVEISENSAQSGGGVSIDTSRDLAFTKVRVRGNVATVHGGGVQATAPRITLVDSTVSGNASGDAGGGVYLVSDGGMLSIEGTTIAQNSAGGGGYLRSTTITVSNSTVSGNADPYSGGGLWVQGTATIRNVTFVDNEAPTASAILNTGTMTIVNSIIAGAAAKHCFGGATTSGGNNLDSNGSCGFAAPGDQNDVDPKLGPLADNGGPTLTHMPADGSPAVDRGADAECPATDQRGESRPTDEDGDGKAVCDVGAVERTVDTCPDDPAKLAPGRCGCGVVDDAAMANGTPDCLINAELKTRIARAKAIIGALASDQDPTEAELNEIGGSLGPYLTGFDGRVVLNAKTKKVQKLAKNASRAIAKVTKAKAGKKLDKAKKPALKALDRFDAIVAPQA